MKGIQQFAANVLNYIEQWKPKGWTSLETQCIQWCNIWKHKSVNVNWQRTSFYNTLWS